MIILTRTCELTPDATLDSLREKPKDVLERQYKKYFETDISATLILETKSARYHNIDAEEVMGMFSAAQKKAPNATLDYLSCKMRAQKNQTAQYLDTLDMGRREDILKKGSQIR